LKTTGRGKDAQRDLYLRGETADAGKLIALLEDSKLVEQAAPRSPTTKIQGASGEVFDLSARLRSLSLPAPVAVEVAELAAPSSPPPAPPKANAPPPPAAAAAADVAPAPEPAAAPASEPAAAPTRERQRRARQVPGPSAPAAGASRDVQPPHASAFEAPPDATANAPKAAVPAVRPAPPEAARPAVVAPPPAVAAPPVATEPPPPPAGDDTAPAAPPQPGGAN
jgi:hypothetical protein